MPYQEHEVTLRVRFVTKENPDPRTIQDRVGGMVMLLHDAPRLGVVQVRQVGRPKPINTLRDRDALKPFVMEDSDG